MKLNPTKCAFGVSTGKFLGFIINSRGIEANPKKIRVVLDMQPPSSTKEIQRLTGTISALSRFVFRSRQIPAILSGSKKGLPLGRPMRRGVLGIKNLPKLPPILVSPSEEELLTLYLVVSNFSTSAAMVRERDRVQQPVYYNNRALRGVEERYPKMEKLVLALVTTAKRLRPYFQAHTIEIPT